MRRFALTAIPLALLIGWGTIYTRDMNRKAAIAIGIQEGQAYQQIPRHRDNSQQSQAPDQTLVVLQAVIFAGQLVVFAGQLVVMREMARIYREQTGIMDKQAAISFRQHIAASRPRLVVRDMALEPQQDGQGMVVRFTVANVGGSTAQIRESHVEAWPIEKDSRFTTYTKRRNFMPNRELTAGSERIQMVLSRASRERLAFIQIAGDRQSTSAKVQEVFVCFGSILYADDNGTQRRVAFWREYDPSSRRFKRSNDPDYEYSD